MDQVSLVKEKGKNIISSSGPKLILRKRLVEEVVHVGKEWGVLRRGGLVREMIGRAKGRSRNSIT